jgi:hypothetical protein
MSTLTIVDVECVKRQDTVGPDSIHVHVGGIHLAGPLAMGKKDVVTLPPNTIRQFNGSAEIELIEVDGAPGGSDDESLGKHTVTAAQAGSGILTGHFNRLSGADYHVRYRVTA